MRIRSRRQSLLLSRQPHSCEAYSVAKDGLTDRNVAEVREEITMFIALNRFHLRIPSMAAHLAAGAFAPSTKAME